MLYPIRGAEVRGPQPTEVIGRLACEKLGIILVTGTTGSGKSTTLASVINLVNRTVSKHIVSLEDPIEFLHLDEKSIINQHEVGQDTALYTRTSNASSGRTRTSS